MWNQLKAATRAVARDPFWAASVGFLLALALASVLAAFALVDTVLFRSLPYPNAGRLFALHDDYKSQPSMRFGVSEPEYFDYGEALQHSAEIAAFTTDRVNMMAGVPRRVAAARVSANFFRVIGIQPLPGRGFLAEEDQPRAPLVVIVSARLWRLQPAAVHGGLAAAPAISVDGKSYRILGVLPARFHLPTDLGENVETDLIFPLRLDRGSLRERGNPLLAVIGRLRRGATLSAVQRDRAAIEAQLPRLHPQDYPPDAGFSLRIVPLLDEVVGEAKKIVASVLGAAVLVYLVALCNAGGLILTRLDRRRKELAVRQALGAPAPQLLGQLLAEAGAITLLGCLPGLGLAYAAWRIVLRMGGGEHIPRLAGLVPDARLGVFLILLVAATVLVLGLIPLPAAWRRTDLSRALRETGSGTTGGRRAETFRSLMVVGQLALCCTLLTGAVLLGVSYRNLRRVDLGLRTDGVLLLELSLPASYDQQAKASRAFDLAVTRIRTLPGVAAASAVVFVPLVDQANIWPVALEARRGPPATPFATVDAQVVGDDFFSTLRIPLRRGRGFTARDDADRPPVMVVSESLARQLWPGEDPLTHRLRPLLSRHSAWASVVGVVGDVRQNSLTGEPHPTLYVSYRQIPRFGEFLVNTMNVAIRTAVAPASLIGPIRREVWSVDPTVPISSPRTLDQVVAAATWRERFATQVFALFSLVAVSLSILGIFSLIVQLVARRTREIAIRMAMGAGRGRILSLIVGDGLRLTAVGVGLGVAAAAALTRLLAHYLYGIDGAGYGLIYLGVALALALAAVTATLLPAWSGANVPPARIMREE